MLVSKNVCYQQTSKEQLEGKIFSLIRTAVTPSREKNIARNQVKIKPDTWSLQNRIKIIREIIDLKYSDISLNDLPLN